MPSEGGCFGLEPPFEASGAEGFGAGVHGFISQARDFMAERRLEIARFAPMAALWRAAAFPGLLGDAMDDRSGFQVDDAAPRHYQEEVRRIMDQFADALVSGSVNEGDAVLDVACGTGFAARAAASVVGGSGSVTGSDINSAMLRSTPTQGFSKQGGRSCRGPYSGGVLVEQRGSSAGPAR